jgi:ornithine cyclodeaminase/alanine dehydrogenase-like protein (mu-crystallin family)
MAATFFDSVRVHAEPFEYVDERTVHDRLVAHPRAYVDFLDRSLADIASGALVVEQPSKLVFTDPGSAGDFRVMPCIVRRGAQVRKTVKIVGTNVIQKVVPDQITVGKAFCLDAAENYVTHIFEACLLSSARTGGCAAIALKRLAAVRRRITIVGGGRVGCYAAFFAAALGGVDEITFVDAMPERARAAATLAGQAFGTHTAFRAGEGGTHFDADVVILATTAERALLGPDQTSASLVISVGADTEHQHELAPGWATAADVYADTLDSLQVGDLLAWTRAALIDRSRIVDLLGVYRMGARATNGRRLFVSTGSALFDNLTISYILENGVNR